MSAMLLSESVNHTLADDLESFLHVLTWVALRYMPHQLAVEDLTKILADVFDNAYMRNGSVVGGNVKRLYVRSSAILDARFENPQLVNLLENLAKVFRYCYRTFADTDNITPEVFEGQRRVNLAKLNDSKWMLDTFQAALNSPDWPEQDRNCHNKVMKELDPQLKRKSSNTLRDSEPSNKLRKQGSGEAWLLPLPSPV
jgi:hypothetical protein